MLNKMAAEQEITSKHCFYTQPKPKYDLNAIKLTNPHPDVCRGILSSV